MTIIVAENARIVAEKEQYTQNLLTRPWDELRIQLKNASSFARVEIVRSFDAQAQNFSDLPKLSYESFDELCRYMDAGSSFVLKKYIEPASFKWKKAEE